MTKFGFFPAAGTNYSVGDEPVLRQRLNALGRALHLHLIGLSGYRTPAHSVAVGGFPNDPHTQGKASDTPGIERVSEKTLNRFGLTRPFSGPAEADHIQLSSSTGARVPPGPADWLAQAGWPTALIPTMVAIGGAESRWQIGATHTNSDGSVDNGWLQINSVHSQYDPAKLRSDPVYTAKAALDIYHQQGLRAWTTYTSGAYKRFLGMSPRIRNFGGGTANPGKTRPGGNAPGESSGPDVTQVLTDWQSQSQAGNGPPDPSGFFGSLLGAITGPVEFFKLLAWIINPVNILRMVEFLVGLVLMAFGFQAMLQAYGERREGFVTSESALSRSGLGRVSREIAATARTAATKGRSSGGGSSASKGSTSRRRIRPEAAPHRTRRQALRLRYEREKSVSKRRAEARRGA